MNIAVRFHSRGGNTKKVADAIASTVAVKAADCSVPITDPVDLLFLGGSVYGFGLDNTTKDFIAKLDSGDVKSVALFGTSAIIKTGNQEMAKLLREKGITVIKHDFYCRGAFAVMHKGHPNENDLRNAAKFAQSVQSLIHEKYD